MMADLVFSCLEYLKETSCQIIDEPIIFDRFYVDFTQRRDRRNSSAPVHRSSSCLISCALSTWSPSISNHKTRFELGKAQSMVHVKDLL